MSLSAWIKESYLLYLKMLQNGGTRVQLPSYVRSSESADNQVYCSSLGMCPLAAVYKRRNEPERFPKSEPELLSQYHLMLQGVQDAMPIQEALLWRSPQTLLEHRVSNDDLRGRIDAFVWHEGERHILEIKRRDAKNGDDYPQPKLSDCYQLMAYMQLTGVMSAHIILLNRYYLQLWSLEPRDTGFVLVSESGELWHDVHNDPSVLNFEKLQAEVARHKSYLNGTTACPMPNFLQDEGGWQCYHHERKPKFYKTEANAQKFAGQYYPLGDGLTSIGNIKPRCKWFCHGDPTDIRTVATETGAILELRPRMEF